LSDFIPTYKAWDRVAKMLFPDVVDEAHFRQPLRKEVSLWFTQRGFDVTQRTISKKDFEAALVKAGLPETKVGAKPGPKPDVDWEMIEAKCYDLMEHHGDFMPGDLDWDCQARLQEALMDYCQETWELEPSESTLREKLPGWLLTWRERKTGAA